uniref:Uncharacterized protein n=1 Tax=Polysiphonia sertularioides TaxID=945028 RepID=A0A1Z1M926_9FLOR|nr:hypothetical protein [Polysiphonia sertularioides]ARW62496.1 hypothetical protein [Polysiphonia sertularioides]
MSNVHILFIIVNFRYAKCSIVKEFERLILFINLLIIL